MSETEGTTQQQSQLPAPTVKPPPPAVTFGDRGVKITDLDMLWRFANYVSKSGFAPKGMEAPESIVVAVEMGLEIGLPPMAAIQNTAVINGRPGLFGDVPLALVRASGLLEEYAEKEVGKPNTDDWGYQIVCRRRGCNFANSTFTVGDAKRAGLWGKSGPWTQYPKRMLKFRARSFLLRDEFGDILKGVKTVDELADEQEMRFQNAKQVTPPPPPLPTERSTAAVMTEAEGSTDDEKAEAADGLAPLPQDNPVAYLGDYFVAQGIDWETFRKWGEIQKWKAKWDDLDGFASLVENAPELAASAWEGRGFIAKQILKAKGEGKV